MCDDEIRSAFSHLREEISSRPGAERRVEDDVAAMNAERRKAAFSQLRDWTRQAAYHRTQARYHKQWENQYLEAIEALRADVGDVEFTNWENALRREHDGEEAEDA